MLDLGALQPQDQEVDDNTPWQDFDDEFDVVKMIEDAYDEDTGSVRDLKIDDRDIPRAKNYFEFCTSFVSKNTKMPFARQLWLGLTLFGEYCPKCSDPKWLHLKNVPVGYLSKDVQEHLQLMDLGVCPKCKGTRSEFIRNGKLQLYTDLNVLAGQRGGKSAVTASLSSYQLQSYLKMPRLSTICEGIQDSTPLTATFVGLRFADAFNLLWTPMMEIIDASPWFTEYFSLLDHYGSKYDKELYKKRDVFIRFGHKNIDLYPSGPTKRGLRGRTRFWGATDEIGWFPLNNAGEDDESDRERADADEVHNAIDRSLLTVRTEVYDLVYNKYFNSIPTGIQVAVSSPASRKDKIWRLVTENKDNPTYLNAHLPTWEMNPRYPKNHPLILAAYKTSPVKAERDYGANPPKTASAFIENKSIKDCFTARNLVTPSYVYANIHGKDYTAAKVNTVSAPNKCPGTVLAIDAGYCLAGDTLVTTSNGIVPIASLVANKGTKCSVPLHLKLAGVGGPVSSQSWHCVGRKKTYTVTLESGQVLTVTKTHEALVLREGNLVSVPLVDALPTDLVACSTVSLGRSSSLPLHLPDVTRVEVKNSSGHHGVYLTRGGLWTVRLNVRGTVNWYGPYLTKEDAVAKRDSVARRYRLDKTANGYKKHLQKPKVMTPDLAFFLGALVSEGTYTKYAVGISNSNKDYLNKIADSITKTFKVKVDKLKGSESGRRYVINGRVGTSNKDMFGVRVLSVQLCTWLNSLGCKSSLQHGRKSAYYKEIPWSILQADTHSQAAFAAAYFEGDGSIGRVRHSASVWTKSEKLLRQFQVMLSSWGVSTYIRGDCLTTSSSADFDLLYRRIEPYLTHKRRPESAQRTKLSNRNGFPSDFFVSFLANRTVSKRGGTRTYLTDAGDEVRFSGRSGVFVGKRLLYDAYQRGKYKTLLKVLKTVSKPRHDKLKHLLDCRFSYSKVASIKYAGVQKVYDLTVKPGSPPFFAANSVMVHNCNNAFALTVGYPEGVKLQVLVALEVQPREDTVLHYNAIYKGLIVPLIQAFNCRFMFADRWQSIALLHRAQEELGVTVSQYSVKYRDFLLLKSKLEERDAVLPRIEEEIDDDVAGRNYPSAFKGKPIAHLQFQCFTVKDVTRTVTKGDGYTDDLFRALALLCSRVFDDKVKEALGKATAKTRVAKAIGAVSGASQGVFNVDRTGAAMSSRVSARTRLG